MIPNEAQRPRLDGACERIAPRNGDDGFRYPLTAYVDRGRRPGKPGAWLTHAAFDVSPRPLCDAAERAVSLRLDGLLSHEAAGRLGEHLRRCPECADFDRRLQALRRAFALLALLPVPLSLSVCKKSGEPASLQ